MILVFTLAIWMKGWLLSPSFGRWEREETIGKRKYCEGKDHSHLPCQQDSGA